MCRIRQRKLVFLSLFLVFVLCALNVSVVQCWTKQNTRRGSYSAHRWISRPHFLYMDDQHDRIPTSSVCTNAMFLEPHQEKLEATEIQTFVRPTTNLTQNRHKEHGGKLDLNLVVLDHYDSFTFNLVDMLGQICQKPPAVYAADCAGSWSEFLDVLRHSSTTGADALDGIILSPGPGHAMDKLCQLARTAVLENPSLPILGVCLGHQILGVAYGAPCTPAPLPIHGQVLPMEILAHPNYNFCPLLSPLADFNNDTLAPITQFNVTRYHSLQVEWPAKNDETENNPLQIVPTAISAMEDRVVMALRHVSYPHFGVQFHPESIGSQPFGFRLLEQFCNLSHHHKQEQLLKNMSRQKLKTANGKAMDTSSIVDPQHYSVGRRPAFVTNDNFVASYGTNHRDGKVQRNNQSLEEKVKARTMMTTAATQTSTKPSSSSLSSTSPHYQVYIHKVGRIQMRPLDVMETFLEEHPYKFWLDGESGSLPATASSTTSILGSFGDQRVEYWGKEKRHPNSQQGLHVWRTADRYEYHPDQDIMSFLQDAQPRELQIHLLSSSKGEELNDFDSWTTRTISEHEADSLLPFSFRGGFVGYLGYEVRFLTEQYLMEQEHGGVIKTLDELEHGSSATERETESVRTEDHSKIPTAAFGLAHRSFVYDHRTKEWYLIGTVALGEDGEYDKKRETIDWVQTMGRRMILWDDTQSCTPKKISGHYSDKKDRLFQDADSVPVFTPKRSHETYDRNFERCLQHIRDGESYELCLTNQLETRVSRSISETTRRPFSLYKVLRQQNPAPFSAFLDWNSAEQGCNSETGSAVSVCCSSPERFISVKRIVGDRVSSQGKRMFLVEAKPIKGTVARVLVGENADRLDREQAQFLQSSLKNRAENLMIVDLLRNDLSRVCETGSVHVAKLMDVETFATVHQMVSTIRGIFTLEKDNCREAEENLDECKSSTNESVVSILMSCFPGGSMTGAPKARTMELLHVLEEGVPRGPYSGALGYISLNGAIDMNKVIRTAVLTPDHDNNGHDSWKVSIGAGGAITALSDNDDEYEELILKAMPVIRAVQTWAASAA